MLYALLHSLKIIHFNSIIIAINKFLLNISNFKGNSEKKMIFYLD